MLKWGYIKSKLYLSSRWSQGQTDIGIYLGTWTMLYGNSESAIYLLPTKKVYCKRQNSPVFCVQAPSSRHPERLLEEGPFFCSCLRTTWRNLNYYFFFPGTDFFWGVVSSLSVHQIIRKKFIKQFLPFALECNQLPGCMRGSLWAGQFSNNSTLNTSLFYGLCLEPTSLHCRFY